MRIDKYICDTINITRSQVRRKISGGCVCVNGVRVRSASEQVDESCSVTLDGEIVKYNKYVYIMMNKPAGVVSASSDRHMRTAVDLLSDADRRSDLFIAGRLDRDTTGFLLITNDGEFAHNILSPKKHIYKTYEVVLRHGDFSGYGEAFESGVRLEDGYVCKPAQFQAVGERICTLRICEGKFHQIKRMFLSLGNEVLSLRRIEMGGVVLDKGLEPGQYRRLYAEEYELLLNKITKNDPEKNQKAPN